MTTRYVRVEGVLVEPIGHLWASFSPVSGETMMLNDESAAILEVLDSGSQDTLAVCSKLASDSGLEVERIQTLVEESWARLIEAGLVRPLDASLKTDR